MAAGFSPHTAAAKNAFGLLRMPTAPLLPSCCRKTIDRGVNMTSKRNSNQSRLKQRAQALLPRIEQIDACGDFEFENTRQRELASIQLMTDLLSGRYLSLLGRQYREERLGWSEDWVDDTE